MRPFSTLDHELLLELQQMIKSVNPCAHMYLQVADLMEENPVSDVRLLLRSPTKKLTQEDIICPQAQMLL